MLITLFIKISTAKTNFKLLLTSNIIVFDFALNIIDKVVKYLRLLSKTN